MEFIALSDDTKINDYLQLFFHKKLKHSNLMKNQFRRCKLSRRFVVVVIFVTQFTCFTRSFLTIFLFFLSIRIVPVRISHSYFRLVHTKNGTPHGNKLTIDDS